MSAPQWFIDTQADMANTLEMEWIEPDTMIDAAEAFRREAAGWRLIDQKDNPSPMACKEYGRHWCRTIPRVH